MIFKTIDADATNLTKKMGLLGKSFNDIKKDYSNGLGITKSLFSTSISESDWKSLQKFNSAIKVTNDGLTKSQRITKAWNENMTGCSIAAKRMGNDLVTGKKKISDVSSAMKTATASTKALEIAMNVFANVGFMLAITAVTKVISELAQAQSNAVETAKEATSAYNDELSSIKDYKEKISELNEELNSGNLSYEETKAKRSELMSIQDELIEKFGTEKSAIESVTEAIGGQVDALDDLNEKSYRNWIAKADDETIWTKLLPWGKSGLDQAIDYMESKKTVSFFDMANANSTTQDKYQAPITDAIRSIQEEIDKTIQSKYNLEKEFATFKLTGTPEEIKSQLESIRQDYLDLSKEAFLENGISSEYWDAYRSEAIESINDIINQFDEGLEKHQETYKTYIEGMIKYDSEYSDEYATILRKRAELEDAENSGDTEKIQKARQEFMDAITAGITASESDENIKKYFESLYPELQAEFANWNFEIAINANTDNLKDEAEEIGKQYSATDLLDMVNTEGVQEGEEAFNKLIDKAIEYGVCTDNSSEEVQKLIDLLVELGIVQGNIESDVQHETPIYSLQSYLDQENMSEVKKSLLELAKSGEISEETFNSTEEYRKILTDLGMNAEEASEKLKEMASEDSDMEDWQKQLQSARTSIEELNKIKSSISSSGITSDSLDTIISKYPELLAYSDDMQGILSAIDNLLYEQKDAAQVAGDALLDYSTVIYDQVVSSIYEDCANANSNLINELAQGYNIDLNNFSSLAQAKEAIDTQLLQTLMEMWGKYYGIVVDSVTGLASVTQNLPDFYQNEEAQNQLATYNQIITKLNATKDKFENGLDFSSVDSAGSAGKSAGDAYLEAFEKELSNLDDLKDRGVISEKEYLDRLRELYQRYFKDKEKYVDQYQKYEKKYLDGMYSLYNSAISGITKLMGNKIDLYNEEKETVISNLQEEKDAAVDALEAQKKAAEESYQAQIDVVQEKIDALEKEKKANQDIIDSIQDEADAIKDAADSRKRDLDLQKAQYELEKAKNQRTILQYSEAKGMHYVKDDSAERSAKESVDDAKREIQIAELEKQIKHYEDLNDAIDDTIEGYNDQIDAFQKLIDESNDYYDNLIDQTEKSYDAQIEAMEKYYDSLIDALEKQKEQFQSLTDLVEEAQMEALLKELGINEEALLNGSTEEFNKLRDAYLGIIKDMNAGNQGVLDSLTELSGVDMNNLTGYLDSTAESFDGLGSSMGSVTDKTGELDNVSNSLGSVSDNAGNASTEMSNLKTASDGLNESLPNVSQQLSDISAIDSENINATTTAFNNLAEAIGKVATALGIGAEDSVGGLLSTLQSLNEVSLGGEDGEGIISQFENLKNAIDAVSSAIGGGGGESSGGNGDQLAGGSSGKKDKSGGGTGGDSSSVTGALDSLKAKADEVLGEGSEDNSEGSGVIGQFGQLKTAVDDVSSAIGTEGSETDSQNQDESTLTGAITNLGTTTEETLGESGGEGVIGRFEQFRDVINEANEHVTGISDGLDAIDGKEVECTIKINIESNGSIPHFAEGTVLGNMNLDSAEYKAKYGSAHVAGTANVQGNWGVREAGKSLVGEEGQELWVHRGTGKFETVGDRGAEFINVQKGDLIFNHEQTKQLLRDGQISSRGKAYANGTTNKPSVLDRLRAQGYEVQKYEWKDMYGNLISPQQMNEAAKAWVSGTYECLTPMNDFKEKIKETVRVIESANVVNNTMNQQPISVTMGDIHLHEVQDVDGLSKAIIHQMPGKMLQAIHQK